LLVGGPLDGASLSPASRGMFIYCAELAPRNGIARAKAFSRPGRARWLYKSDGIANKREVFLYAGHQFRRCEGCGSFLRHKPTRDCALCGHESPVSDQSRA
jgi:hypothetical protein